MFSFGDQKKGPKYIARFLEPKFVPPNLRRMTKRSGSGMQFWDAVTGACHSTLSVGGTVSTFSFYPEGSHLKTNRGNTPIPPFFCNAPFRQKNILCAVFVEDHWVAFENQKCFRLIIDRLAQLFAGTLSVWHMHLAMLHFSGLILKVFLRAMNLHRALLILMLVFIIGKYLPTSPIP